MLDNARTTMMNAGWMRLVAQSTTGSRKVGSGCQDFFAVTAAGDGLLIAIADGAGSAVEGANGAKTACTTVMKNLQSSLVTEPTTGQVVAAMVQARAEIAKTAEADDMTMRDYACTIMVLWLGPNAALAWHLGDGGCVLGRPDGHLVTLVSPDNGEHANETHFLTATDWRDRLVHTRHDASWTQVAAFTDGLQRLALEGSDNRPFPGFFTPVFGVMSNGLESASTEIDGLLQSPRLRAHTDDDLTIVLVRKTQKQNRPTDKPTN